VKSTATPRTFLPTSTRSVLRWIPHFFFIVGIFVLGYVAITLLSARLYQARESHRFEQALNERKSATPSSGSDSLKSSPTSVGASPQDRSPIEGRTTVPARPALGRITIPSIGLSSMILEGIDQKTMQRGVGHIPGTALLDQPGNVALARHRDTFFRTLRKIRKNDEITVETLEEAYRYRVDFTQVVAPDETEVLNGSGDTILTLVTCYPFSFVGPAPQRFVVRAHRISDAQQ
jgi:sortase A